MKSVSPSFSFSSAASCALTMSMSMLWSFQIPFPELFVFCFRLRLEHLPRRRRLVVVFAFWRCELNFLARCWRSIKTQTTTKGISSSNNNNNNDNAKWPRTAGERERQRGRVSERDWLWLFLETRRRQTKLFIHRADPIVDWITAHRGGETENEMGIEGREGHSIGQICRRMLQKVSKIPRFAEVGRSAALKRRRRAAKVWGKGRGEREVA